MITSRLSRKGQITLPIEVRKKIHAVAGDLIQYEVEGDRVILRRVEPFDRAFHSSVQETLGEWGSAEDEKSFGDL